MKKVLVLGSNSFSGAAFAAHLLQLGDIQVIGASRSPELHDLFLPYRWQPSGNFSFEQIDINHDLSRLVELMHAEKPECVVNFAAQSMVAESWQNPGDWFMTNTVSTVRLHDELRKMPFLHRYVHISTPEVYGSCSGGVTETHPFNPSTPYAVSRAAMDMSLRTFHAAYGFPVVTTRAANVFGAGQQLYRIIPRTILFILLGRKLQLHGGGYSTRSFIHISDVVAATWQIACSGRIGEVYHITTDRTISIRALVEIICQRLGVNFKDCVDSIGERQGKDAAYHLDGSKLRRELNWVDRVSLEQGIEDCIAWVSTNLDTLRHLPFDYRHKP